MGEVDRFWNEAERDKEKFSNGAPPVNEELAIEIGRFDKLIRRLWWLDIFSLALFFPLESYCGGYDTRLLAAFIRGNKCAGNGKVNRPDSESDKEEGEWISEEVCWLLEDLFVFSGDIFSDCDAAAADDEEGYVDVSLCSFDSWPLEFEW